MMPAARTEFDIRPGLPYGFYKERKIMESDSAMFSKKKGADQAPTGEQCTVELISKVNFPTRYGLFTLYGFHEKSTDKLHTVMVRGDVEGTEGCLVRIHSECHTGDVLGSMRCDCGEQLESSLEYIGKEPKGVLIYLKQEGRGIGLLNKLKAYSLQDEGLDTVEANESLGFPAETREYGAGASIIRYLGIRSVVLMTNNPDKIEKLCALGIHITGRMAVVVPPNRYNKRYLKTKKVRMGHLL